MASCGESEKYLGSNDRSRFGNVVFFTIFVRWVMCKPMIKMLGLVAVMDGSRPILGSFMNLHGMLFLIPHLYMF